MSHMMPPDPDGDLSRRLQAWRISPPVDPQFRPAIWERLRRQAPVTWTGYLHQHRATWAVTVALAVIAAGWVGRSAAHAKIEQRREQMVVNYLGAIDPRVIANLPR